MKKIKHCLFSVLNSADFNNTLNDTLLYIPSLYTFYVATAINATERNLYEYRATVSIFLYS